jgi:hypothetical protein
MVLKKSIAKERPTRVPRAKFITAPRGAAGAHTLQKYWQLLLLYKKGFNRFPGFLYRLIGFELINFFPKYQLKHQVEKSLSRYKFVVCARFAAGKSLNISV